MYHLQTMVAYYSRYQDSINLQAMHNCMYKGSSKSKYISVNIINITVSRESFTTFFRISNRSLPVSTMTVVSNLESEVQIWTLGPILDVRQGYHHYTPQVGYTTSNILTACICLHGPKTSLF
jgi:hypothetical protein